jgi:hypothetical protein
MTLCIGAFSHPDRAVVSVSDRMVSVGDQTADGTAHKGWFIHGDWAAHVAGDLGAAAVILEAAKARVVWR